VANYSNPEVIIQIKAIIKSRGIKTRPTYQEIADSNAVSLSLVKKIASGKYEEVKEKAKEHIRNIRKTEDINYGQEVVREFIEEDEEGGGYYFYHKGQDPDREPVVRVSDAAYLIDRFTRLPRLLIGVESRLEIEAKCRKQFVVGYDIESGTFNKVQKWMHARNS
jgi:hypothetical protein